LLRYPFIINDITVNAALKGQDQGQGLDLRGQGCRASRTTWLWFTHTSATHITLL